MNKLISGFIILPFICFSQANILNTKTSSEIENVSKKVDYNDFPLPYEFVSDDDIIFSFTTWEIIDLNERVNFPLYYPTDIELVSADRRPLIHYLLTAIEDPLIGAQPYTDENFTDPMNDKDIDRIRVYKRLKSGVDADGVTEGKEHFEEAGSWRIYLESIGYEFPEDETWVNFDPLSDEFIELQRSGLNDEVKEYLEKWEDAASSIMDEENFDFAEFNYSDVRKYLLKGIWYFDKKATQLKYRPIAIGPVATNAEEKFEQNSEDSSSFQSEVTTDDGFGWGEDEEGEEVVETSQAQIDDNEGDINQTSNDEIDADKEYRAMFWLFFPELRDVLHKAYAFNEKNMSKPISFDHLINSRRFSATIYKESNVYQDRDIRKYIGNNSLMQLLESQRIKEKIRNKEQDMWNY
ncbi:gliding motility protein GldN [Flavobacteriaceae bacterium]|nr:gliding motility protein GldN [Flavobacteriaceae bacterium]